MKFSVKLVLIFAWISLSKCWGMDGIWNKADQDQIHRYLGESKSEDDFSVIETNNYTIKAPNKEFGAEAGVFMEKLRNYLIAQLSLTRTRVVKDKAIIIFFKNRSEYQRDLGEGTQSRGWFKYKYDENHKFTEFKLRTFLWNENEEFSNFYIPILMHEGTHEVIQEFAGINKVPYLINEGFASYMQGCDVLKSRGRITKIKDSFYFKSIKDNVMQDELESLSGLFSTDIWDIDDFGRKTNLRYLTAEIFIEYCLSEAEKGEFIKKSLSDSLVGQLDNKRYREKLDLLQDDFSKYVNNRLNTK